MRCEMLNYEPMKATQTRKTSHKQIIIAEGNVRQMHHTTYYLKQLSTLYWLHESYI